MIGFALIAAAQQTTVELDEILFVQNPPTQGAEKSIRVVWIPQPVQKYCADKTTQQCIDIDYCIRTRNTKACQNLGVDGAVVYPPNTRPRRVLTVFYFPAAPVKGLANLLRYVDTQLDTFDRLSAAARIKARIRLTRSPDDDQFELLEVVRLPPF
jgi:hypothetical protein